MRLNIKSLETRLKSLEKQTGIKERESPNVVVNTLVDGGLFILGDPSIIFKDQNVFESWIDEQEAHGQDTTVIIDDIEPLEYHVAKPEILTSALVYSRGRTRPMNRKEKEYRLEQITKAKKQKEK